MRFVSGRRDRFRSRDKFSGQLQVVVNKFCFRCSTELFGFGQECFRLPQSLHVLGAWQGWIFAPVGKSNRANGGDDRSREEKPIVRFILLNQIT